MRLVAVTVAFAACLLGQDASVADWRFAHPSPTLVGGLRLKALLDSPTVTALIAESAEKDPNSAAMVGMLNTALGGVVEVRFSLLDKGGNQMDALVLVTGKLDEDLAGALSQGTAGARRIDENTVLLGNGPSLDEAVKRMGEPPSPLANGALTRGGSLTGHDLWAAGSLPDTPMTADLSANLRGLALGLTLSSDLAIELAIEAADAAGARQLVALAREAEAAQPQLGAKIEAVVEGTTARFGARVPAAQVAQLIREAIAAQTAGEQPAPPAPVQ